MATHIGIGFSQRIDTDEAASEAAELSRRSLKADTVDMALIFSTIHYNPQKTINAIQSVLEQTK